MVYLLLDENGFFFVFDMNKIPDVSKIETFNGSHFNKCQERVLFLFEMIRVVFVPIEAKPEENQEQFEPVRSHSGQIWKKTNKICRHVILSTLTGILYDVY